MPFCKYYDTKFLLSRNLLVKLTLELTVGFLHGSLLLVQDAFNSESHLYQINPSTLFMSSSFLIHFLLLIFGFRF